MRRLQVAVVAAIATAALAQSATAQNTYRVPNGTPIQEVHLDLASGEITPMTSTPGDALVPSCFSNSNFSGFFAVPTAGTEWVDWGVKSCGLTGAACELIIGYGTTALDPGAGGPGAEVLINLYAGTVGSCDAKVPLASYALAGLPGSADGVAVAAFSLTVDIATAGFITPDGPIGWGYADSDGLTGPLLITTPDATTGTVDAFDLHTAPASTGACAGTFALGTPNISSFWMEIGEDDGADGAGSASVNPGTSCNVGVLSGGTVLPNIGATWDPAITTAAVGTPVIDFLGISSAPAFPTGCIPGIGEILIDISGPNPLVVLPGPSPFAAPIPPNCALIGVSVAAQAGQVDITGAIGMTNGLFVDIGV